MLGDLSGKYESNGDPGCISDGYGDPGGKSYGEYQLSSNAGSLQAFINWLSNGDHPSLSCLGQHELCSDDFDSTWKMLADNYYDEFKQAQHDYIKQAYYDPAIAALANFAWHIENHAEVMQDVVWSRSVQYGPGNIIDMWTQAVTTLGYPNLSYVDSADYDERMINAIYLTVCSSTEWNNSGLRDSLNSRFASEAADAISRL